MDLLENPFCVLGATPRCSRRRISDLAEERALETDPERCRRAGSDLGSPRKRLAPEAGWLLGANPDCTRRVLSLLANPSSERDPLDALFTLTAPLPPLARANALSSALRHISVNDSTLLSLLIQELAEAAERVDAHEIQALINQERAEAGISLASDVGVLSEELEQRQRHYADTVRLALGRASQQQATAILTSCVENATQMGHIAGPRLLDTILDDYEVDVHDTLEAGSHEIEGIISEIRDLLASPVGQNAATSMRPAVERLVQKLKEWDRVAQPIQVSSRSRGLHHRASRNLAYEVRSLAIDLYNGHEALELSQLLTHELSEIFAEDVEIAARASEDAATLERLGEESRAAEKLASEYQSLPDDDAHGNGFLRALVALHVCRAHGEPDEEDEQSWKRAVAELYRLKPEVLRSWLAILRRKCPDFSAHNKKLLSALDKHAGLLELAYRACEDPLLPRAIKAVAAVCLLSLDDQVSRDERRAKTEQALGVVAAAYRVVVSKGIERIKNDYGLLYASERSLWEKAAKVAGTELDRPPARTRWANELGSASTGPKNQEKKTGPDLLKCLLVACSVLVVILGVTASSSSPKPASATSSYAAPPPPPPAPAPLPQPAGPPPQTWAERERHARAERLISENNRLVDEVERLGSNLERERAELDNQADQIEQAYDQLERDRLTLDHYDTVAVDAFNARLDPLRAASREYKASEQRFNQRVAMYNAKLRRLKEIGVALDQMGIRRK